MVVPVHRVANFALVCMATWACATSPAGPPNAVRCVTTGIAICGTGPDAICTGAAPGQPSRVKFFLKRAQYQEGRNIGSMTAMPNQKGIAAFRLDDGREVYFESGYTQGRMVTWREVDALRQLDLVCR